MGDSLRPAGAADEPGAAQAHRSDQQIQHLVIFINQIRMKIGVMFGTPETTTGGNALKFYASVRLDIRRIGAIKEGDEVVGNRTRVKVVKNKLAPPFKQVEFDIMYGEGVSKKATCWISASRPVSSRNPALGSHTTVKGSGQGRENSKAFLKANPDMTAKIEASIRQTQGYCRADTGRNSRKRRRW